MSKKGTTKGKKGKKEEVELKEVVSSKKFLEIKNKWVAFTAREVDVKNFKHLGKCRYYFGCCSNIYCCCIKIELWQHFVK
jgi:hypothetical protein